MVLALRRLRKRLEFAVPVRETVATAVGQRGDHGLRHAAAERYVVGDNTAGVPSARQHRHASH
jgi:hypothetical protein